MNVFNIHKRELFSTQLPTVTRGTVVSIYLQNCKNHTNQHYLKDDQRPKT